ncbi:MAG TPA: hypothetical protein VI588_02905 [Candidatus Gracilibacteria bacterium]|nr:hypothetical protein [Candidatus Gracilibacteria bacterium]
MKKAALFFAALGMIVFLSACSSKPLNMTEVQAADLAQCLKDQGAQMYGAFWCPHCAEQKRVFGDAAAKMLPYFECDPRGENPVTDLCLELKIEKYPTWIFADGTRIQKVLTEDELKEQTGCE